MGLFSGLKKAAKSVGKTVSRAASDVQKKVVKAADTVGDTVKTAADVSRMVPGVGNITGAALDSIVTMGESGGLALTGDLEKAGKKMAGQLQENIPAFLDAGLMLATGGGSAIPTTLGGIAKGAVKDFAINAVKNALAPQPVYSAVTETVTGEKPVYSYDVLMNDVMTGIAEDIDKKKVASGEVQPYGPVNVPGLWAEYVQNTTRLKEGV